MLRALYLVNAALLTVHEIDSAYWREWELFRLPGGHAAFLVLHLPLVAAVLWGYGRVLAGARAGTWASLALAGAGIVAPLLHGAFLAQGRTEFATPASLGLLAATGMVSLAMAGAVAVGWSRRAPPGGDGAARPGA